jgi:endonuclease YncB( thermonuclease family)
LGKFVQFKRGRRYGFWRRLPRRSTFQLLVFLGVVGIAAIFKLSGSEPRPAQMSLPTVSVPRPSVNPQKIMGQASVIDGDTIEIHRTRIRLFGIDAPEGGQTCTIQGRSWPCGQRAAFALSNKIGRQPVECRQKDRDQYNRVVAICLVGNDDINGWMVEQGWALAFRRFSNDYVDHERRAVNAKRGMWEGEFEAPWDWRRNHSGQARPPRPGKSPHPPPPKFVTPP